MNFSKNEEYILKLVIKNYSTIPFIRCEEFLVSNYISKGAFYKFLNKIGFSSYYKLQNYIRFIDEMINTHIDFECLLKINYIYKDFDLKDDLLNWINESYSDLYNIYCILEEVNTLLGNYIESKLLQVLYNMTCVYDEAKIQSKEEYKAFKWLN